MKLLAVLAACVALTSCAPSISPGKGVVAGGIIPCSGFGPVVSPHYAAGTVSVLEGADQGAVLATEQVAENQTYRFTLKAGNYLLVARYAARNGAQPNIEPRIPVTVKAGETLHIDFPNECF